MKKKTRRVIDAILWILGLMAMALLVLGIIKIFIG